MRPDVVALLTGALDSPEHPVVANVDQFFDGEKPATVVQATFRQESVLSRWLYRVEVTLTTFARSVTAAWDAHVGVADRLLQLNYLGETNDWYVSSIVCESEPSALAGQAAPGWDGQVSRYEFFIRHKGGRG